ncbi:hypothetical protein B0H13DRAFT_1455291, partial [Mycena leptocephala]
SFLQTIQTEVLLSYYVLRTGHRLEARAHTASAVALALGGGLHHIRSSEYTEIPLIAVTEAASDGIRLQVPTDAIDEGERINGFWTVLMLQINLSVAIDPAVGVYSELDANGTQIDTPWPLDIEDYQRYALKCVQRF